MKSETINWGTIGRIALKASLLFVAANLLLMLVYPYADPGKISLYNWLWPGRERLPFGEDMGASNNLSLADVDAMFASHVIAAPKEANEYRVVVLGDSSIWGTLLQPDETLPAQLQSALKSRLGPSREVKVYNLGYPTMSLLKDVMMLDHAMQYDPDLIIWGVTLQSFPNSVQEDSAIVQQNSRMINEMAQRYPGLIAAPMPEPERMALNFIQQQRPLADLYRLQLLGFLWGATGIDQVYPDEYEKAQVDFAADSTFGEFTEPDLGENDLSFNLLRIGKEIAGDTPLVLLNEPIMISNGVNHEIRYNYYYPRWAYDQYRTYFAEYCESEQQICLDYWDLLPMDEFTNTAVHYSAEGAHLLAEQLAEDMKAMNLVVKN